VVTRSLWRWLPNSRWLLIRSAVNFRGKQVTARVDFLNLYDIVLADVHDLIQSGFYFLRLLMPVDFFALHEQYAEVISLTFAAGVVSNLTGQ
jgi:hypothetical protein